MTAPLPPYQPGSPAWRAGYEHCRRQAVEMVISDGQVADAGYGAGAKLPHLLLAEMISAMRPTPPRVSPGMEPEGMAPTPYAAPTTLHARVAAQDSASGGNALCGDLRGNEGVVG